MTSLTETSRTAVQPSRSVRRAAVIGTGMIAKVHARAAVRAGVAAIGVLGSSPERSRQAVAAGRFTEGFERLADLLAWEPDVVHVCTPNVLHASYVREILDAGIHVVCEKPLAISLDEARELERLADAAGVVATVPFVYRYHPMVQEARARVRRGELGEIALIHGTYLQDWMLHQRASNWRVDPSLGGPSRAFADIGSHWCDLIEYVTGQRLERAHAVLSVTHAVRPALSTESFGATAGEDTPQASVATEDVAIAQFVTSSNVPVSVVISQVSAGRKNRLWFEIDGTRASATFDQEYPETLGIGTSDGMLMVRRGEGVLSPDQDRLNRVPAGHGQGWEDAFAAFVADTYAAITGETIEGLPTFADGARSAAIVEAVLRSAEESAWASIEMEDGR